MLGLKNEGMLLFMMASRVLRLSSCILALIPGGESEIYALNEKKRDYGLNEYCT